MKKGQSAIQIIFGLFILLIVTLVILGMFFKTTEKGQAGMKGASTEFFTKQNIDKAVNECSSLCDSIKDIDTAVEYCKKIQKIDFNGNGVAIDATERGRYKFCEDNIPCFILSDCSAKGYSIGGCYKTLGVAGREDIRDAISQSDDTCGSENINWKDKFTE